MNYLIIARKGKKLHKSVLIAVLLVTAASSGVRGMYNGQYRQFGMGMPMLQNNLTSMDAGNPGAGMVRLRNGKLVPIGCGDGTWIHLANGVFSQNSAMPPAFQQNSAMPPAFQQNSAMLPAFQQNSAMLPAF
ncbi:MAG: hypothetical protein LBT90_00290, partial [Holosporaceae bacterium]|nr:hypothetical protein [Holosporaceae bacterium]